MNNMTNSGKTSSQLLTEEVYAGDMPRTSERAIIEQPAGPRIVAWHPLAPDDYYADQVRVHDKYLSNYDRAQFWRREAGREWPGYPTFLADAYRNFAEQKWYEANARHRRFAADQERLRLKKERTVPLNNELGPREFTLTYSPGKHYLDDDSAKDAMNKAIERLTKYYRDEIIEFHAVGEFTAAGRPHIHGWYHLSGGRKITDKNFKRAYPPWNPKRKLGKGFEGGHHQTIERVSDFAGYAEKHLEEAWHKTDITKNANDPAQP